MQEEGLCSSQAKRFYIRLHVGIVAGQKLFGFVDAFEGSGVDQGNAIAKHERLAQIMRHEDHGLSKPLLELPKLLLNLSPGNRIECAEWFIHQQNRRVRGKRPSQADALLLSAGELAGIALGKLVRRQTYQGQHLLDPR